MVGSFYIFAIWVGFGVLALYEYLKKYANKNTVAIAVSLISLIAVPTLMASENWDDHDRSNRYTSRLNAKAYLDSCDENAILFTIGDNDTFPLWYMQEVENYRTDMKLINTSLFQTDWYIDQMKRKTYEADPIPSQLTHDKYKWGTLDVAYYFEEIFPQLKDSTVSIDYFMKWIESDKEVTQYDLDDDGNPERYKFRITDYITSVIKGEEPEALSKLVLKNYVATDNLGETAFDTIVSNWNWIPKGVVLHGNRPENNEKRIKLEIFYSK